MSRTRCAGFVDAPPCPSGDCWTCANLERQDLKERVITLESRTEKLRAALLKVTACMPITRRSVALKALADDDALA